MLLKALLVACYLHLQVATANTVVPFVNGGNVAYADDHKHLVRLTNAVSLCSGSILTPRWVLSCAHCFEDLTRPENIIVSHYHSGKTHPIATAMHADIIIHHKFIKQHPAPKPHDLALVKTMNRITFDRFVQPIRVASVPPPVGSSVVVAGFGRTDVNNILVHEVPTEGKVKLTKCVSQGLRSIMCSKGSTYLGGGDSGGPVTLNGALVGVNHAVCNWMDLDATKCRDVDYYAKLADDAEWIRKNIQRSPIIR